MKDINEKKYGYDASSTLYHHYKQFGVIKESEAKGGSRLEIKAGLVYDSRDFETAPNKGLWAEFYVNGSPDVFGDGFNYLKLNAHFRHYVSIPFGFKVGDPSLPTIWHIRAAWPEKRLSTCSRTFQLWSSSR